MVKNAHRSRTRIKILGSTSMQCEAKGCSGNASFLFRADDGSIAGYCELHAAEKAAELNVRLPELPQKVLRAGW